MNADGSNQATTHRHSVRGRHARLGAARAFEAKAKVARTRASARFIQFDTP